MKVIAIVPDGNIMDRLRLYSRWNPGLEWYVIAVREDAGMEPDDWVASIRYLHSQDREVINEPPGPFPDLEYCQYEVACHSQRSPFIVRWLCYDPKSIGTGLKKIQSYFMSLLPADILATWGERGWYNEIAISLAAQVGLPVCRLERASFPGTIIADGTGLEQGRSDLSYWHGRSWDFPHKYPQLSMLTPAERLHYWLSMAIWQNIEQQARTTAGMVDRLLDDRPSLFVPLQVPFDTNIIFRAHEFNNFTLMEHVAEKYPNHRVLVKGHPSDNFSDVQWIAAYCADHGWEYITLGSHAIIEAVDGVVSINSQCIVEAWMHQTNVEILGEPAFDLPEEDDKRELLHTLRFSYYIEPWQLSERLQNIIRRFSQ